jgi:hypothetical protein
MYLHNEWNKFAPVHNLEDGYLLTFLYEGDNEMIVKVFAKISCRTHYHTNDSGENTDSTIRVLFLCSKDGHRPIKASSVGFYMFLRIQKYEAAGFSSLSD